jgi:nitrite reductase (NADH) large subunit
MQKTYIVIGTSAAGIAAVQKIRQADAQARIICFSEETEFPYNKCFLADFLGGQKELSAVYTKSADFFESFSVELYLATRVVAINRVEKTITCSDGTSYSYTALLLAVGAASRTPTCVYQKDIQGFFPFYTLHDTLAVHEWIQKNKPKTILIMGAGLTGLEVADALRAYTVPLTVVEQQPRLLMRHSDPEGAMFIVEAMKKCSVNLVLGVGIQEIVSDASNRVEEVVFTDGTSQKVEMIVGALGSCARLELAQTAGLCIEQGGVITNEYLQTNDPTIFAAGDVALVKNRITGELMRTALWPDAVAQGMYAGSSMTGQLRSYPGLVPVATSSFFGVSFHSAGFLERQQAGWSEKVERTVLGYSKVIVDEGGVVKGFICLGELVSPMVSYKRSLVSGAPL